ncbi:hypothetical protein Glove_13g251 [Diversispora epigaea]|uniref:BTB domain-containing protein n=1 Tax=Diversispora epigaea TaxID=1348612 RepID=A0A397JNR2_9GLOM|nr:hypothetical protein Glove_13g251 [Diversispora epigaea]
MALNFYENLSSDFIKLLENGDENNIIIEVGESSMKQPFKAHSTVLCYRCPYLYDEFKKSTISNNDNIRIIQKPQISAKIFDIIIKPFLLKIKSSWLKLNFSKIYNSSFQTNNLKALQNYCNDIIAKHPNLIFESNDFNTLPVPALVSIILRDDLQLEEPKIWDYVIQWGISQNQTLPSNIDDWIDKDFQILKSTLQQCIPHIRYFQISNKNIVEKLFPYQQILDKKLWDDILKYSLAPNTTITSKILPPRKVFATQLPNRGYTFQITSSIINIEQATEIASWVDKKEKAFDINNNPYEFNLILLDDTDEIIGGYNPIGWNSYFIDDCSKTNDSFIFSLKNGNIKNSILSRVKNAGGAIFNVFEFGPSFNGDLWMNGTQTFKTNGRDYYENPIRKTTGQFNIDDYEVFQIKKR